ncbi:MAG: hypothetical protein FJZ01_22055 [Candidatus Sericytochromatia bacterium]|nr:hypothetical protein [Candidatus Tanganyikabacteria bacterium]
MPGREELGRQHHIPEDDLDDVLEIAQRLQHQAQAARPGVSRQDLDKVASELAIEPQYVEQAVGELERSRERAARERQARAAARQKLLRTALAGVLAVVVGTGALGAVGAAGVNGAAQRAASARTALEVVIDRQVALLPQLVALGGGTTGSLGRYEARLRDARTVAEKLAVSRDLATAMASRLGQLPPATDPAAAQQRLSLQHEVVGMQNRITTEQRRYQEAVDAWRGAASSPTGRIAMSLRWAPRPPD